MAMPAFEPRRVESEFLACLNHEIRAPLNGVLGMVDLLLETALDEQQREFAAAARECAAELLGHVNAALGFSEVSAGGVALAQEEFNLTETLQGAARQHERKAGEKGLGFAVDLDDALPPAAVGDAVRLGEIVSHLVGHAVRFTSQGEVQLKANAGPSLPGTFRLNVGVRDTGTGLAPCLALALAEGLVAAMGGELRLEAEAGKGSLASFWVPLRDPVESSAAPAPAPAPAAVPRRVLVVEDDLIAQRIISHRLSQLGCVARVVSSGEEAVKEAAQSHYDVLLMEARRIGELRGYEGLPVIALTARAGGEPLLCRLAAAIERA